MLKKRGENSKELRQQHCKHREEQGDLVDLVLEERADQVDSVARIDRTTGCCTTKILSQLVQRRAALESELDLVALADPEALEDSVAHKEDLEALEALEDLVLEWAVSDRMDLVEVSEGLAALEALVVPEALEDLVLEARAALVEDSEGQVAREDLADQAVLDLELVVQEVSVVQEVRAEGPVASQEDLAALVVLREVNSEQPALEPMDDKTTLDSQLFHLRTKANKQEEFHSTDSRADSTVSSKEGLQRLCRSTAHHHREDSDKEELAV